MPDPEPKLRVIDEAPEEPSAVVRLGPKGVSVVPVERLPGLKTKETPERLESEVHENFDGRSLEPGVEAILDQQAQAENIEQPWVRHPERVRPMIEEAWKSEPKRRLKFERMNLFQPASMDDRPFWVVRAEVEEGEMQNLLIEQTGEAEVKVDWETHVCRQPMPWETYVAERPKEGALDFRVWAVPDQFFNHEFSDGRKWKCFRLTAKGAEEHLFGYALADSDVYRELNTLCQSSEGWRASVVVRLRIPEGSVSPRGVVIEKIVAPRWLILDDPGTDAP